MRKPGLLVLLACLLAQIGRAQEDPVERWIRSVCVDDANANASYKRLEAAGPPAFPKVLAAILGDRVDPQGRLPQLLAAYAASMDSTEPYADGLKRLALRKDPATFLVLWEAFGKAGPSLLPSLEALFVSPDPTLRSCAGRAVGAAGPSALPLIRKHLGSTNVLGREAALMALSTAGDAAGEFAPAVASLLSDKRPAIRSAAATAYGAIAPDKPDAARVLLGLLNDREESVRKSALDALDRLARSRIQDLLPALEQAKDEPRRLVVRMLCDLPAEAAPAYGAALLAASPAARVALLEADPFFVVPCLPANVRRQVVEWAKEADTPTRAAALRVVCSGRLPDPAQALEILKAAARAPDPALRAASLTYVSRFDGGIDTVKAAASDPDEVVRMEAACVLMWSGAPGPEPLPLCVALLDRSPAAAEAIGELGIRGLPAIDDVVRVAASPECGSAARLALRKLLDAPPADAVVARPRAVAAAPKRLKERWEKALQWLADAQEEDGRWDAKRWGGAPGCDIGVTGLALLALLAGGNTDSSGPQAAAVGKAMRYLYDAQGKDGWIGQPGSHTALLQHGIATAALCEAACVCRGWRPMGMVDAYYKILAAQNPGQGWRYEPRAGENDTFVTTWMVMALKASEMQMGHPEPAAYGGALAWIQQVTDPVFGCCGYTSAGGPGAHPEQVGSVGSVLGEELQSYGCTAAGLWVRLLVNGALNDEVEMKSVRLFGEQRPVWGNGADDVDECYWLWGALVEGQCRSDARCTKYLRAWRDALERSLLAHQAADGSWEPVGVWGRTGGKVFSTAMATLSLLAPYAYPEGCFTKEYRRKLHPAAYKLLGR